MMFVCEISRWIRYALLALVLAGSLPSTFIRAQDYAPAVDVVDCPDTITEDAADDAEIVCGWLHVPESRPADESDRRIALFWLRLEAQAEKDHAPILYLAGGPGDAASAELTFWQESALHRDYDIILFDQRGTGLSQPSLDCHENDEVWLASCRDRLLNEGIDLSAYNSASVVMDVLDLLTALQLESVNLYGTSYGSRLALMLVEMAPEGIRSLVLDGVYPPPKSHIVDLASNLERTLERLFVDCESAPACNDLTPDLRRKFYSAVEAMNEDPPELTHLAEGTGWFMDGDEFLAWNIGMLRYPEAIVILPFIIEEAFAGIHALIVLVDAFVKAPYWNEADKHTEGVFYSVICADDLALEASARWRAEFMAAREEVASAMSSVALDHLADCEAWNVPPTPAAIGEAVSSDVPTLLFSGAYDFFTPPHYGEFAAETLDVSWHIVFPAASHGILETEDCATSLMLAFLADPHEAPGHECLDDLQPPDFELELQG